MELVAILRELWRHRLLVLLGAVLAVGLGLVAAYRVSLFPPKLESRQYEVGLASAGVLVDTPDSQVVGIDPEGSDSLGLRASLLANLMSEGSVKASIARRAGVPDRELAAVTESSEEPPGSTSTSTSASEVEVRDGHLLTIRPDVTLPIIKIDAQAPDVKSARALANAAVASLESYLDTKAASERVKNSSRLVVTELGAPKSAEVTRGPSRLYALGLAIMVFLGACASIVIVSWLARGWRMAEASERSALSDDTNDFAQEEPFSVGDFNELDLEPFPPPDQRTRGTARVD
jgi:lambda repressor-like predicted transcriptional regulator